MSGTFSLLLFFMLGLDLGNALKLSVLPFLTLPLVAGEERDLLHCTCTATQPSFGVSPCSTVFMSLAAFNLQERRLRLSPIGAAAFTTLPQQAIGHSSLAGV
eukprot:Gb_39988 [translate_table: standard]